MCPMNPITFLYSCAMADPCVAVPLKKAEKDGNAPAWYFPQWLAAAPFAPVFQVQDTVNKYGLYADKPKIIYLKDLIKFHGHFCGGLVEAATALKAAFDVLFPACVIDRTDLRIASNNSPCGADTASYLSGARPRFGTYYIDKKLGASEFVMQQISTEKCVHVSINEETYPTEVRNQMRKIESGDFSFQDLERFQQLQWDYGRRLVSCPAVESVDIREGGEYRWPDPPCPNLGRRKDNDYKDYPQLK